MTEDATLAALAAVIEGDQAPLPPAARQMAEAIRARHGAAVRALVFYGSALRAEGEGKMLDFYVIVSGYRAALGPGLVGLAAALLPPSVHFLRIAEGERPLVSKYAVISEGAFLRRASGGAFESMLWARFAQPATIVTDDMGLRTALIAAFARAARHLAAETRPLLPAPVGPHALWQRGLAESYRTELRPEAPGPRAAEIVARFPDRYARLSAILLPTLPVPGPAARVLAQAKWALRRALGKPRGALRVVKAATTFDGGLDYLLDKVAAHSGVRLTFAPWAHRHPVLAAPWIAWRLYRAGAFR